MFVIGISGASASGKTTLLNHLIQSIGITKIRSTTTRSSRSSDNDGDYEFLPIAEFNALGDLLWQVSIGTDLYGLRRSDLRSALRYGTGAGFVLTPDCHLQLRAEVEGFGCQYFPVHLLAPDDDERQLRMYYRGDSAMTIASKLLDRAVFDHQAIQVEGINLVPPMLPEATAQYVRWLIGQQIKASV